MATTIELTSKRVRCCRIEDGKIVLMESYPVPADGDPIQTLTAAPLPANLGKVRVLLQHQDLLLQTMVQPPCPPDRLDRIVRFELQGLIADSSSILSTWMLAALGGSGDMRILVQVAKKDLVQAIEAALKPHGATLGALVHPAIGLFQAWKQQNPVAPSGDVALIDCGGSHTHVALVRDGELAFLRSHSDGMDSLAQEVANLRGIESDEARRLLSKIGKGAPEDIQNLIGRSAQSIGSAITAVARFAQAQLRCDAIKPDLIVLAGAGGQVPGFVQALSERSGHTVSVLNPFAGLTSPINPELLDEAAALPSPWTVAIGGNLARELPLDVLSQQRQERAQFWRTSGILRVAAIAAAVLMVLALGRQYMALSSVDSTLGSLEGQNNDGLVPRAQSVQNQLNVVVAEKETDRKRTAFLRNIRRPGTISIEFLNAFASSVDPSTRRVTLTGYRVRSKDDGATVVVTGHAEPTQGRGADTVLEDFQRQLIGNYPAISNVDERGAGFDDNNRLTFEWSIAITPGGQTAALPKTAAATSGRR